MTTPAPRPPEEHLMWTPDKGVLMAACMKAERSAVNSAQITAIDCVNGTVVDESRLPAHYMNFTYLWALFEESQTTKPDIELPPQQNDLVIYNTSRLLINLDVSLSALIASTNYRRVCVLQQITLLSHRALHLNENCCLIKLFILEGTEID
jgi:hypothetical protein